MASGCSLAIATVNNCHMIRWVDASALLPPCLIQLSQPGDRTSCGGIGLNQCSSHSAGGDLQATPRDESGQQSPKASLPVRVN